MGENKKLRKQIASWLKQIDKHEEKIATELLRPNPDEGSVRKWRKDIRISPYAKGANGLAFVGANGRSPLPTAVANAVREPLELPYKDRQALKLAPCVR
jgi:hypothetical protein